MNIVEQMLQEEAIELAKNPFKKGDMVRIKKEFLEKNERHSFHVVKDIGIGYADLTEIIPEDEDLRFNPILRTKIDCIEPEIFGNCLKENNEK